MASGMEEAKSSSQMQLLRKESGLKTKNNDFCVTFIILIWAKFIEICMKIKLLF